MKIVYEYGLWLAPALMLLSACQTMDVKVEKEDIQMVDASQGAPEERMTMYDNALSDFGVMMEGYDIPQLRLQSKVIANKSIEKAPDDLSPMVESAVGRLGKRVKFIPWDPAYWITEDQTGLKVTRTRSIPQYVISGAITEFDKDLVKKTKGGELDLEYGGVAIGNDEALSGSVSAGASKGGEAGGSRIVLDLKMIDYSTQELVPGVQTINAISIVEDKDENGLNFTFLGSGFGLSSSLNTKQGLHSAIRLLVNLSVLQLLGQYYAVPYWRCIPDSQPNEKMIASLRDDFDGMDSSDQMYWIRKYMYLHGYDIDMTSKGVSAGDQRLIDQAMVKYGAKSPADLWIELWETVPYEQSRKLVKKLIQMNKIPEVATAVSEPEATKDLPATQPATSQAVAETAPAGKKSNVLFRKLDEGEW